MGVSQADWRAQRFSKLGGRNGQSTGISQITGTVMGRWGAKVQIIVRGALYCRRAPCDALHPFAGGQRLASP